MFSFLLVVALGFLLAGEPTREEAEFDRFLGGGSGGGTHLLNKYLDILNLEHNKKKYIGKLYRIT